MEPKIKKQSEPRSEESHDREMLWADETARLMADAIVQEFVRQRADKSLSEILNSMVRRHLAG